MLQPILNKLRPKMEEVIGLLQDDLRSIRTGKASSSLVENIQVSYYGSQMPLKQTANITTPDATLIVVQPWDANALGDIEVAIRNANLGLGITNDGRVVRLVLPPMTEERRLDFIKIAHQKAESARIVLRNLRKESWEEVQKLEKAGSLTEDDRYRGEEELNKIIESFNKKIQDAVELKEKELKSF